MVLISGHTETDQLGRGGFQELRQVDMAAPVCKAAWMATNTATVGMDVAKAIRIATTGRPGPVHLSLPSDILDATVPGDAIPWPTETDFTAPPVTLPDAAAAAIIGLLATAKRPLVIGAPRPGHPQRPRPPAPDRDRTRYPRLPQRGTRAASTMPVWAPIAHVAARDRIWCFCWAKHLILL